LSPDYENLPHESVKVLERYGNLQIQGVMLTRTPLSDKIKFALNLVSLGEWDRISSEYDHYFHLRLIVNLYDDNGNLQQIQLEKRARVNIFDDLRGNNEFTEYMSAGTPDPITLNELVENTRTTVGNYRFYSYDGFNNNCQGFVKMLLETMGLWNERNKKFTYQDTIHVINQLPDISQKLIRFIPVLGNIIESRIIGLGKSTHRLKFLKKHKLEDKSYSLEELSKISKIPIETIKEVYNRGIGAYKTNPRSVRMKGTFEKGVDAPMGLKLSKEQWAYARVYSYLNGSKKHDVDLR